MSMFWLGTALIVAVVAVALGWPALRRQSGKSRPLLLATAIAAPLAAVGLYAQAGHPGMTDRPLAHRGADRDTMRQMAAYRTKLEKLARELTKRPDNVEAWTVLGAGYGRLGAFAEASDAYARAHALRPKDPTLALSHAEMLMRAAEDRVTPQADAMLDVVLAIDPADPKGRLLKGLSHAQAGHAAEARAIWRPLLAELPETSPWRSPLEETLARLDAMPEAP